MITGTESTVTGIVDVTSVAVPVRDQDRAVRFYVEQLGFEVRLDVPTPGGGRWVQVGAPGGHVALALVTIEDGAAGADTGITLLTSDASGDHDALVARGVDVGELLRWPGVPTMFVFHDDDGNQLKIIEAG